MEDSETAQQLAPDMALSPVEDQPGLYIGGLWALRRSDALTQRNITHVLSLFPFEPSQLKNLRGEPWDAYGKGLKQLTIDIHDVDDEDLLVELPQAVRFIHQGLTGSKATDQDPEKSKEVDSLTKDVDNLSVDNGSEKGSVFVHCAAGKSRSASVVIAYLLWRYPSRFDPSPSPDSQRPRRETATEAVTSALALLRRTRPMVDPNDGFMSQLALWWEMGCPADKDMDSNPLYQRWAYKREVMENTAVGQAPPRLRFEDEEQPQAGTERGTNLQLRCKKCRRTLTTSPFIIEHNPGASPSSPCPHVFIEPLSWMRDELEKGQLSGRLLCPNARCGAGVGRYDWKGFKCTCGEWVTPALSLQRARVDEVKVDEGAAARRNGGGAPGMGIRMPPGLRGQGGNL